MWDAPCETWLTGEQAEFRITTDDASVDGSEQAVAPSGLRATVADGAVNLGWDASPVVAPLRADAAVVYAVWRERVDEADSGGVGDEPVHNSIAGTGLADSDVVAGGTYRYAVSVANEGYDNSSLPGESVTVEVPELLGDADPGVARFTVGDADPVDLEPDARRRDVAVDSGGGHTTVSVEANAFDARLSARSFRADQRTVRDHDLGAPVQLSGVGDTLLIVYARSGDGTQEQAYTLRLRPPNTANVPNVPKGGLGSVPQAGSVPQDGIVPKPGAGSVPPVGVGSVSGWLRGPRSGLGVRAVSDPSLSALTLSSGTLAPAFASGTHEYGAAVAHDVDEVTVTPTAAAGTTAVVAAPDADPATTGHQIALNASTADSSAQTAVVIVVWNSAGRLDSYTLTITRAATSTGDTTLSALTVSGLTLVPAFDPAPTEYTATAAADTATVTVTPTAATSTATAAVKPDDAVSGTTGHQVNLTADADTVITVTVTAQDSTTRDYTVTVTRPPAVLSSDATLASLDITGADLAPDFGTASFPEITLELPEGCTLHDLGRRQRDAIAFVGRGHLHLAEPRQPCEGRPVLPPLHQRKQPGEAAGPEPFAAISRSPHRRRQDSRPRPDLHGAELPHHQSGRGQLPRQQLPLLLLSRAFVTLRRGSYVVEVAALFDLEDSPSREHSLIYEGVGIIRPLELQSGDADITELVAAPNIYTADVRFDTDSVTVAAVANHADARVVVSPDDAAPETDGHQVALIAPADGESSARTVVSVAVTAQDGTRDTYAVVITRPAAVPAAQITMELPEGCVLHDLGPGSVTEWRRWDDDCDSLHNTDPQRAAQYYRLYIGRDSNVRLIVKGDSSSDLVIRSADGTIVAKDLKDPSHHFHHGELFVTLPRGVYVVEVAAHWYHFGRPGPPPELPRGGDHRFLRGLLARRSGHQRHRLDQLRPGNALHVRQERRGRRERGDGDVRPCLRGLRRGHQPARRRPHCRRAPGDARSRRQHRHLGDGVQPHFPDFDDYVHGDAERARGHDSSAVERRDAFRAEPVRHRHRHVRVRRLPVLLHAGLLPEPQRAHHHRVPHHHPQRGDLDGQPPRRRHRRRRASSQSERRRHHQGHRHLPGRRRAPHLHRVPGTACLPGRLVQQRVHTMQIQLRPSSSRSMGERRPSHGRARPPQLVRCLRQANGAGRGDFHYLEPAACHKTRNAVRTGLG